MSEDPRNLLTESRAVAMSVNQPPVVFELEKPENWAALRSRGVSFANVRSVEVRSTVLTKQQPFVSASVLIRDALSPSTQPIDGGAAAHWVIGCSKRNHDVPNRDAASMISEYMRQMALDPEKVRRFFAEVNENRAAG